MIVTQQISERGWRTNLVAPATLPKDRDARLAQMDEVLRTLAPIFQPLALEVEFCWRELDTGLPASTTPEPAAQLMQLDQLSANVTIRSTMNGPFPSVTVATFDRDSIASLLHNAEAPDPNLIFDWQAIRSLAARVYTWDSVDAIRLEQLGQPISAEARHWFAGPVGDRDFAIWPPAKLELRAEDRLRLAVTIYWSGWYFDGSAERKAFEKAFGQLQLAGWILES
jgi:hypothetical protein